MAETSFDAVAGALNSKIATNFGNFKIETFGGNLITGETTNIYNTGITFNNYAIVSVIFNNRTRTPESNSLTGWNLQKNGTFAIDKVNASYGGSQAFSIVVLHD